MNKERINQIFEIFEDYCENQHYCKWCPFSDDSSECKFKTATGEIPPTFYRFLEDEEQPSVAESEIASEDVQPVVHAHWILLSGGVARCSNCNRSVGSWDYDNTDNYCRVCGAMMDEESEAG